MCRSSGSDDAAGVATGKQWRLMAKTPGPVTKVPSSAVQPADVRLSRRRRMVIWVLVVLASLIAFISIVTTWVQRQMLDDKAWQNASAQIIQDPKVQQALSVYIVNQLYDNGNVSGRLEAQLPANLKPLAGPISAALRQPATQGVQFLLVRPRIQQLWIKANAVAHEKLVNVLENKSGFGISTGSGNVTIDLSQMIKELGASLGLPAAALAKLPANTGVITVMRSDQLSAAQQGVQAIRVLSVWLLVLVLALWALAIYLAHGIRRETLRNAGWGLVTVGLLVLLVRKYVGNYVVDGLTAQTYRVPVRHVWLIGTQILGQIGWASILYGLVAVVGAVIAGPTRAATALRAWIAPVLNNRPEIAWTAFGLAYLLLVYWGGTHALRTWWGILLLGGLLTLGLAALRRQTLREFPAAGLDVAATTGAEAGSGMALLARKGPTRTGPARRTETTRSPAEEIARLHELRNAGAITDEEFERGKQIALS